jgi:hypothetical protein
MEILKALVNAGDEGKRFLDIFKEVWPAVREENRWSEKSFHSSILNILLDELKDLDKLIDKKFVSAKNVRYFILEDQKSKVEELLNNSIENLRDPLLDLLKFESKRNEVPLMMLFSDHLQVLLLPCYLKIYKAASRQNDVEFEFYKKEGQRLMSSLYGTVADFIFKSKDQWFDGEKIENELNRCWRYNPPNPNLATAATQMFQEPWNMKVWLKEKYRQEKKFYGLPDHVQQQLNEKRLIESVYSEIIDKLNSEDPNEHEEGMTNLRKAREQARERFQRLDELIKKIDGSFDKSSFARN